MVLQLKLPANERLQFLAGQYLEFLLKDGTRRSFSMANAPHDDELVELHVRHVAGGQFTDHVFGKMKENDILRFEGPLGTFFLREDSAKPIVFVASGTGFAPIKAIIEHALHKGVTRPMTLYWGGRRPQDLYMNEVREYLADQVRAGDLGGAARRRLDRAHGLRAPRGDGGLPGPVRPPGLRLRRADHGRSARSATSSRSAGCRRRSSSPTASPPRRTWRPASIEPQEKRPPPLRAMAVSSTCSSAAAGRRRRHTREGEEVDHAEIAGDLAVALRQRRFPAPVHRQVGVAVELQQPDDHLAYDGAADRPEREPARPRGALLQTVRPQRRGAVEVEAKGTELAQLRAAERLRLDLARDSLAGGQRPGHVRAAGCAAAARSAGSARSRRWSRSAAG